MVINAVSLDRILTLNPGGQPSNRQRDRIGKARSLFVRKRDRGNPAWLAVNVTGSIIADRGITADTIAATVYIFTDACHACEDIHMMCLACE